MDSAADAGGKRRVISLKLGFVGGINLEVAVRTICNSCSWYLMWLCWRMPFTSLVNMMFEQFIRGLILLKPYTFTQIKFKPLLGKV